MKPARTMQQQREGLMDCIVIGGCANGVLLKKIRQDASFIELKRPDYVKPLESSTQIAPDICHETDVYEVHPLGLYDAARRCNVFGLAVLKGKTLAWGFSQLVIGYTENTTAKLISQGFIDTH